MITASFYSEGTRLTAIEIKGHSGYAPEGQDIVCAAVTSALRLVETTVNDVLGLEAAVRVKDAQIFLKLPGSLGQTNESVCQALFAGLMVYLVALAEEYPDNISVLEV